MKNLSNAALDRRLEQILRRRGKSRIRPAYWQVADELGGSIASRGDRNRLIAAIRRLDRTAIREGRAAPGSIVVRNGTLYPGEGFVAHAAKHGHPRVHRKNFVIDEQELFFAECA